MLELYEQNRMPPSQTSEVLDGSIATSRPSDHARTSQDRSNDDGSTDRNKDINSDVENNDDQHYESENVKTKSMSGLSQQEKAHGDVARRTDLIDDDDLLERVLEDEIELAKPSNHHDNDVKLKLPVEQSEVDVLGEGEIKYSAILETESNKVIKSSVEILVPVPSESEGISDDTCDVPFCDNSPPLYVLNDHFKIFFDFNDDCTSSDDDSFDYTDYVEASPLDSELVSLEEVKDDILYEKLLNINILIAKIESLNDNPTPDCVL
nr:hypothetical protein [Tanacetum cinerariifolium]